MSRKNVDWELSTFIEPEKRARQRDYFSNISLQQSVHTLSVLEKYFEIIYFWRKKFVMHKDHFLHFHLQKLITMYMYQFVRNKPS